MKPDNTGSATLDNSCKKKTYKTPELPAGCTATQFTITYYPILSRSINRRTFGNSEDYTQEVFARFFEKWSYGFESEHARKSLWFTTRNVLIDRFRRKQKDEKIISEPVETLPIPALSDSQEDVFRISEFLTELELRVINRETTLGERTRRRALERLRKKIYLTNHIQPAEKFQKKKRTEGTADKKHSPVKKYFLAQDELTAALNKVNKALEYKNKPAIEERLSRMLKEAV